MSAIIQFTNLTQTHQNRTILHDLSLTVEEGEAFGFVGTNGSGKTTAIRIMATLLVPTHGDVFIDGHSVKSSPELVRKLIGYVPDQCGFYPDMTAWDYLDFFGACYKIHYRERIELISTLIELVDLTERKDTLTEDLSLGMKQRLGLARALLHDPKVLILDDPLSNLDFYARSEFMELLSELSQMGKTIFLSSHILADVARICDRVGIMEAGQLVACGSIQGLKSQLNLAKSIQIKVLGQAEDISPALEKFPGVLKISADETQPAGDVTTLNIKFQGDDNEAEELLSGLIQSGVRVLNFSVDSNDIEDVFTQITKGIVC